MYQGRDQNLQFDRATMWKMDIGSSYNILKGSGTISARFSDIFNSMNFAFAGDRPYKAKRTVQLGKSICLFRIQL
jgi:hypothetical protein